MIDALIENCLQTLPLCVLAAFLAGTGRSNFNFGWLAIAILLIFVHDALITRLLWQIPGFTVEGQWNWVGKLLGLAGTLAIAALPIFGFRRSGITLRQQARSRPAWLLAAAVCSHYLINALLFDKPSDTNTVAFMWTMPGPEEEFFYRGVLLLALNRAFAAKRSILGAELGWAALLTSVQFGAAHGISYEHGSADLDLSYFLHTFVSGLAWVWMREKSGSVAPSVISHSFAGGVMRVL